MEKSEKLVHQMMAFGLAARDTFGVLSPFIFSRRYSIPTANVSLSRILYTYAYAKNKSFILVH